MGGEVNKVTIADVRFREGKEKGIEENSRRDSVLRQLHIRI